MAKEEISNKLTKQKKKESSWFRVKKTFFGIGKEFSKISWPTFKHVLWAFVVIFFITAFLVLLFYIVDDVMSVAGIISSANNN